MQENCLELKSFSSRILMESKISLLAVEGNLFDMKAFHDVDGYDQVIVNYFSLHTKNYQSRLVPCQVPFGI